LNPIERLWKVMNEHAKQNKIFDTPKAFKNEIFQFFDRKWPELAEKMKTRINDNFEIITKNPILTAP
jgi:transposase